MQRKQTTAAVETGQAISRGIVPPTSKLTEAIRDTEKAINEQQEEVYLDQRGEALAFDAKKLLDSAEKLLREKNQGELFQKMVAYGKQASEEATQKAELTREHMEIGSQTMDSEIQQVINASKTLSFELVRSKEFRLLLLDTIELLQNIFWKRLKKETHELKESIRSDIEERPPTRQTRFEKKVEMPKTKLKLEEESQQIKKESERILKPSEKEMSTEKEPHRSLEQQKEEENETTGLSLDEHEKKELSEKFRGLLAEFGKNENYHRAINGIFSLFDQLKERINRLEKDPHMKVTENDYILKESLEAKLLLERFTRPGEIDSFLETIQDFLSELRNDRETSDFFKELRNFIVESMNDPSSLEDETKKQQFDELLDISVDLLNRGSYCSKTNTLIEKARKILLDIKEDSTTKEFSDNFNQFVRDMLLDSKGQPTLGGLQDSLQQMRALFLPVILKQMQNIPVAKIEGVTPKYDYILDNVSFSGFDILPEHIHLFMESDMDINLKEVGKDVISARLYAEISNIQAHLKDIKFAYRRKVMPQMEDNGITDIDFNGVTFVLEWVVFTRPNKPMRFLVNRCACDIGGLKIHIKQAESHSVLDKLLSKLFSKSIKKQIEEEIQSDLKVFGISFSDRLNDALLQIYHTPLIPQSL